MARPVMLGNGSLTVGLNEQGLVNDFYYPYVGLDNLNTSRNMHHRIGVWVDGVFSWVDDDSWQRTVTFENSALVSTISMEHHKLQLRLDLVDFVDHELNAFCRQITVTNQAENDRHIRLFMHQVFQISRAGRGDTALYVPNGNYILDYKGRCNLLVYGQSAEGVAYDQFAVGNYGIEDKDGTYRDAEDGELSGNAVEHGGVDSVIRFSHDLPAGQSHEFHYWVIAADSQFNADAVHNDLLTQGLHQRLESTREYWQEWLKIGTVQLMPHLNKPHLNAVRKSLMVIKAHMDKRGGIIASCDSSIYNYGKDYYSYVWPRDGAYAMWPLIRLGYRDEPRLFFEFCRDVMTRDGYLMHKYQPDRAIGSTWHPLLHEHGMELAIQEDETAGVVFMLGEYLRHSNDRDFVFNLYTTFVQPAANFMSRFMDEQTNLPHATYDLWEERFLTSTYTTAVTHAALLTAAGFADTFEYPDDALRWRNAANTLKQHVDPLFDGAKQRYRKGFLLQPDGSLSYDDTLDVSSFFGVVAYGLEAITDQKITATAAAIETTLLNQSPSGGAPRYEHDHYFEAEPPFLGNPWFVTTLWMAQYYAWSEQKEKAADILSWTLEHALPSGILSEQIDPTDGSPVSVTPLVWSHAELINTILAATYSK